LFGSALVYGATRHLGFVEIAQAVGQQHLSGDALLVLGLAMIIAGIGFKASAAPFHMWTPDVYQGAPTPVTAYMSAATKVAALLLGLRLMRTAFPQEAHLWTWAFAGIAVASLTIGNLAALVQRDVKRMLAYSSISHAGFMLIGLSVGTALGGRGEGMSWRSTAPRHRRGEGSWSSQGTLVWLVAALALALFLPGAAVGSHQGVDLDQCSNGQFGSAQSCPPGWQNGDLNPQNSFYREGDSVPFRATLSGLSDGTHTFVIQYDTTKSGKHAYDYLTSYDRTVSGLGPCDGVSCSGSPSTFPIPMSDNPVPPNIGLVPASDRNMTL
jgi:Proton-conducting membrane transporter